MPEARILYVEGNVDGTVGGSYFSLLYLASRLDRSRFRPIVLFAAENELIHRFRAADIAVMVRRPARPFVISGWLGRAAGKALNFLLGWVLEPVRLAALLRRERVSVVHLNNSIIKNHPWMLAAWVLRIPCVTHERGINPEYLARARLLARTQDAIICISGAVRDNMVALGLGKLPLVTIHNGLDPAAMRVTRTVEDIREELALDSRRRLVGLVGNLKAWKGQSIVVRALALLHHEFPDVVCLLIGGASPDEATFQAALMRLIEEQGLAGSVVWTGYRSDVANYINALEIQIHASISPEPFGRVLLEAMALAKPLIASSAGGVQEIVVDGETGLLFEPDNPASLASRLRTLLMQPARAAEMGRAGYERLVRSFSIDQHVREVEALYARILR
ncbi:MAG: glycosyltransferase family 4 protein [Steroidobacteraceae bacterium]